MGRFINADTLVATGQGILGNNMFAYCGNNPVSRIDASGTAYEEEEEYRAVGAGIQVEIDIGNGTAGFENIVYWDVQECDENSVVIATYTYSGGSVNFLDEYAGSITAVVRDNLDLVTSGTDEGLATLISILEKNYSASVSGLLLLGNDQFSSVKSYEGLFMSMYGSVNHVKGAFAVSSNCIAIAVGGTSSVSPSWGISVTNYTLRGIVKINDPFSAVQCTI